MTRRVALIGFGAIARQICAALATDDAICLTQIIVRPESLKKVRDILPPGIDAITSPDALHPHTDFVLECAGHDAVWSLAAPTLARGVDFGVLSAGALARQGEVERLTAAAKDAQARLLVVPGAIGGIDAVAAAGDTLEEVRYTARKPPLSWRGSPADQTHDLAAITDPTAVFSGTAREAALAFPRNANVVATVALAGVGFDRTHVTLLADPGADGNSHHIAAIGPLFEFDYKTTGDALPENPKTSALTARSALRAIRQRAAGFAV